MHRAQTAYTELLSSLNTTPDALCLLQEPYVVWGRLPRPRGCDVFPSSLPDPRTAIYSPKHLKAQEISHLCNRDCTVILINGCSGDLILASVYLDITLPAVPDWLDGLMEYSTAHPASVLLAVDSNSHSTLYGPDQNPWGTTFEEFIF